MSALKDFSQYISKHAELLSAEVVESVVREMNLNISELEKQQANLMYIELLGFYGHSLLEGDRIQVPESLLEWSKKNAEMQVASGGKISEIVIRYPITRQIFSEIFTRLSLQFGLSVVETSKSIKGINAILDVSLNETFYAFERFSEKYQAEKQVELLNLSAPIVPILEDVVVLPLVGVIDSYRVAHILNNVIPRTAEQNVNHVVIDFSGVLTIDAHVAQSIQQIGATLQLMGIHVVIAGLRPDLVQTIVHSGIDMLDADVYATVKQALECVK